MHRLLLSLSVLCVSAMGCAHNCSRYSACVPEGCGCEEVVSCKPCRKCRHRRSSWASWISGTDCGCDSGCGSDGGCAAGNCGADFSSFDGSTGGCATCGQHAASMPVGEHPMEPITEPQPYSPPQAAPTPAPSYPPAPPPAPAADPVPMPAVETTSGQYFSPQATLVPPGAFPTSIEAPPLVAPPMNAPARSVPTTTTPAPLLWVPSGVQN